MGHYQCFSCGEKGDVFTWVMKTQNVDFVDALKILADQLGIKLKRRGGVEKSKRETYQRAMDAALAYFRSQLELSAPAKSYCERRGLDADTLAAWEIGYAPDVGDALARHLKSEGFSLQDCREVFLVERSGQEFYDKFRGRLIFPIRDERDRLVAFGGRTLGDGHPKYINSSKTPIYDKGRVLYGLHKAREALKQSKTIVLVEGYTDTIACHRAGLKTAIANLGTALTSDQARLLARWCEKVVVLYDSDEAGQKAAERSADILKDTGVEVKIAVMNEGDDPDTLLNSGGAKAVQAVVDNGIKPLEHKVKRLEQLYGLDDPKYWSAVAAALASADPRDREEIIMPIAQRDPTIRDPERSASALREKVRKIKIADPKAAKATAQSAPESDQITGVERAVFLGFMDEEMRKAGWSACCDTEIFVTAAAARLAEAIASAWPNEAPSGQPTDWIEELQPGELREQLLALSVRQSTPLQESELATAIERLQAGKTRRKVAEMRQDSMTSDDDLMAIHGMLKQGKTE